MSEGCFNLAEGDGIGWRTRMQSC